MPKRPMPTAALAEQVLSEQSISLRTGYAQDGAEAENGLVAIEQDIRALMHQAALLGQEKEQAKEQGRREMEKILLAIIEVLDAFGRVYRNVQTQQEQVTPQKLRVWLGHFRTVRRLLDKILEERGVVPLENLDGCFDPRWHIADVVVVDRVRPHGAILEEERPGYLWQGQLLRKAGVKIASSEAIPSGPHAKDGLD